MSSYTLKREIPIESGWDIIVTGGGPGGYAAAACAARLGARVLLLEAMGCLGGMGTSGQVCVFSPIADGEKQLVRGFMGELIETLYERGFLRPGIDPDRWRKNFNTWPQFRSEGLKMVLDEIMAKEGVEVRFFTRVIDADADSQNGIVRGVVTSSVEGYKYIEAKAFIDATGDAILSDICGVQCREAGRDTDRVMPSTLTALFAGIDWSKESLDFQSPETVKLLEEEYKEGRFEQCDRHFVGLSRYGESTGYMNGGHIFDLIPTNTRSLSDGMVTGRRTVRQYEAFLRKYSPNCENIELVTTASLMGVRESRRIVGEYELKYEDYISRREFPDQIGVFNYSVDIHPYDMKKETYDDFMDILFKTLKLKAGERYGIPYGILVPKGFKNLWVAGRCNSSDIKVHGAIRTMPACGMMGQAAGTAAVQSIRTGQTACGLNTEMLVESLRKQGAFLPQTEISESMTRV